MDTLPAALVADLYRQVAPVEATLRARLLRIGASQPEAAEPDRLLRKREAAKILATSEDSLNRRWPTLTFAFKDPIDGHLKFSLRGIERYIASQTGKSRR